MGVPRASAMLEQEGPMAAIERVTRALRSGYVSLCARVGFWLCLFGSVNGCLNPMPEDYPSNLDVPAAPVVEAPPNSAAGSPVQPRDPGTPASGEDQGAQNPPAEVGDAGAPDAGRDAGVDPNLADAGADAP
jgi:hypothetical protein